METLRSAKLAVAISMLVLLAGCTSLDAVHVKPMAGSDAAIIPPAGAPYTLPFTQYEITVKRRLAACEAELEDPALLRDLSVELQSLRDRKVRAASADNSLLLEQKFLRGLSDSDLTISQSRKVPDLVVAVAATIKKEDVPDPARQYVIDMDSLQSFFTKTNMVIDYHDNGMLKGINAEAESQVGPMLASMAKAAGGILVSAASSGTPAAIGKASQLVMVEKSGNDRFKFSELPKLGCNDGIAGQLQKIEAMEDDVSSRKDKAEELTADLERLTVAGTAMGKAWGKEAKKLYADTYIALSKAKADLSKATDALGKELKHVTITTSIKWPADGGTFGPAVDPHAPGSPIPQIPGLTAEQWSKWGIPADAAALERGTAVYFKFKSPMSTSADKRCQPDCPGDNVKGLKYRMPVAGSLVVFTLKPKDAAEHVVTSESGMIPQLGPVFALPLKSIPFSKKKATASFDKTGLVTTIGLSSGGGAAEAAGAFEALVAEAAAVRKVTKPSALDKLNQQIEYLEAQKKLQTAQQALETPPSEETSKATAAFHADTALAEAELANLKAHHALDEAKALLTPN